MSALSLGRRCFSRSYSQLLIEKKIVNDLKDLSSRIVSFSVAKITSMFSWRNNHIVLPEIEPGNEGVEPEREPSPRLQPEFDAFFLKFNFGIPWEYTTDERIAFCTLNSIPIMTKYFSADGDRAILDEIKQAIIDQNLEYFLR
jgi:hypothetical protein